MIKRLLGLTILVGLIFVSGIPAFADSNYVLISIDKGSESSTARTIRETSKDIKVAIVRLSADAEGGLKVPEVTIKSGDKDASGSFDKIELSVDQGKGRLANSHLYFNESDGATKTTIDDKSYYGIVAKLLVSPNDVSAGTYTVTVKDKNNNLSDSFTLTIEPWAKGKPEFADENKTLTIPLGSKEFRQQIPVKDYPGTTIIYSTDEYGKDLLEKLGLSLDKEGYVSADAKAVAKGVSYDQALNTKNKIKIRATVNKQPKPFVQDEFTINITGIKEPAIVSPEVAADSDLGKLFDPYGGGLYVGDEIASKDTDGNFTDNYKKYLTFKVTGTLPIHARIDSLPSGLKQNISPDVSDESDGFGGKNGYKLITISGKPTNNTTSTIKLNVSNDVKTANTTQQFKITTLKYPAPTFDNSQKVFEIPLGATSLDASYQISPDAYPAPATSADMIFELASGQANFAKIGLSMDKHGRLSPDKEGVPISYDANFNFSVKVTVSRDQKPSKTQEFTIKITGTQELKIVSPDRVAADTDISKLYDKNYHNGFYVGQPLTSKDEDNYDYNYLTFKIVGTLPISADFGKLPGGLSADYSQDVSIDSDGSNGRNGYRIVTLRGTITSKDFGTANSKEDTITLKYFDAVTKKAGTKTQSYTITRLYYPKPAFDKNYPNRQLTYNIPLGATSLDNIPHKISLDIYNATATSKDMVFSLTDGRSYFDKIGIDIDKQGNLVKALGVEKVSYADDFKFKVKATVSKGNPNYSYNEQEYTIHIEGGKTFAMLSPDDVEPGEDLGKLYDNEDHKFNNGLYTGDRINTSSNGAKKYLTFKFEGILPISVDFKGLPAGVSVDYGEEVSYDDDGYNGKNGYRVVKLGGIPQSSDSGDHTVTVTATDAAKTISRTYKMTTLAYPKPVFTRQQKGEFTFTLGDKNQFFYVSMDKYSAPSNDVTFIFTSDAADSLDKIGVALSADGKLFVSADTGVSYDKDFTMKVKITVSKDTFPSAEKEFKIHVEGGTAPELSADKKFVINSGTDIGVLHDREVNEHNNGLYVGDPLNKDSDTYKKYFTFTFKGTLPLNITSFDHQLPHGMSIDYGTDTPNTGDEKNGSRIVKIGGIPDSKDVQAGAAKVFPISFDVSNSVGSKRMEFKMSVLRYPAPEFADTPANATFNIPLGSSALEDSFKINLKAYNASIDLDKDMIFTLDTGKGSFDLIGLSMDVHGKLSPDKAGRLISYDKSFSFRVKVTVSRDTKPVASKDFTINITGATSPDIDSTLDLTSGTTDLGKLYDTEYHKALYNNNYSVAGGLYVGDEISKDSPAGKKYFTLTFKGTLPLNIGNFDKQLPDKLEVDYSEDIPDDTDANGKNGSRTITIYGTPKHKEDAGTHPISFDVSNALGSKRVRFNITTLEYPSPVFDASQTKFEIPLGISELTSKDYTYKVKLNPYTDIAPSSDISFKVISGEKKLKAMGLVLQDNGQLKVDAANGVSYDKDFVIRVQATVSADTKPTASKDFTVSVTGAKAPVMDSELKEGDDIGKKYDSEYTDEFENGLYVGEELSDKITSYLFKFTFTGTLPLEIDTDAINEQLPEGMTISDDLDQPAAEDANKKNGTRTIHITGTPTESADKEITITVSNALGTISPKFKITVLPSPKIEQPASYDVVWGKGASINIKATGFKDAVTWSYISADSGVKLESNDLVFSYKDKEASINGTWKQGINTPIDFGGGASGTGNDELVKTVRLVAEGSGRTVSKDIELNFILVPPEISFEAENFAFIWSNDYTTTEETSKDLSQAIIKMSSGGTIKRSGFYSKQKDFSGKDAVGQNDKAVDDPGYNAEPGYLPEGLAGTDTYYASSDDRTDDYYADYVLVYGKPKKITPLKKYIFWAENDAGISSAEIPISVGTKTISIDVYEGILTSGDIAVGKSYDKVILKAYPGPVNWSAANLPEGVKLTPNPKSNDVESYATISGTFTAATTTSAKGKKPVYGEVTYVITAANSFDKDISAQVSANIWVHGVPVISEKLKISDITVDKVYKSSALVSDTEVQSWDIRLIYDDVLAENYETYQPYYEYDEVNATYGEDAENMMNSGKYPVYASTYFVKDESFPQLNKYGPNYYEAELDYGDKDGDYQNAFYLVSDDPRVWDDVKSGDQTTIGHKLREGSKNLSFVQRHSYLYVDNSNPAKPIITGSIDRMPDSGKLTIKVIAHNHGVRASKDFTINVKAASPKLATKTFVTAGSKETSHDWTFETTGSKPIRMAAYIDGKTANKIFGTKYPATASIDITYHDKENAIFYDANEDGNITLWGIINDGNNGIDDQIMDNPTRLAFYADGLTGTGHIKLLRYGSDYNDEDMNGFVSMDRSKLTDQYLVSVDDSVAFKGLPVTIRMENWDTDSKKKPVTANVKLNIDPIQAPEIWFNANAFSKDAKGFKFQRIPTTSGEVTFATEVDGEKISGDTIENVATLRIKGSMQPVDLDGVKYVFFVKGDNPITVTSSQKLDPISEVVDNLRQNKLPANAKNGIYITSVSVDASKFDSNAKPADGMFYIIGGTPKAGQETTSKITLTAKNNSTGATAKKTITIKALMKPQITVNYVGKEFEINKKLSLKGGVKGSTSGNGIRWYVDSVKIGNTVLAASSKDAASALAPYGLSLDKNGVLSTGNAVATKATYDPTTKKYASMDVYAVAYNAAGKSDPLQFRVGIKGTKPKVTSKTLEFYLSEDNYGVAKALIKTDAVSADSNIQYSISDTKTIDALKNAGFDTNIITTADGYGMFATTKKPTATKGISVKFDMENYGTKANGSVKVAVYDPKPVIEVSSGTAAVELKPTAKDKKDATINLKLSSATEATGDSKISWKITGKPSQKGVTAKLNVPKENNTFGNKATVTVTAAKGMSATTDTLTVQATNSSGKNVSKEFPIAITVTPASTQSDKDAPESESAPETGTEAEAEQEAQTEPKAEAEEHAGTLTFGRARTEADLSDTQKSWFIEEGYQIVAILPEMQAEEDGLHEITNIALAEDAPVGAELVYFPFPVGKALDDEEGSTIFYDETGDITAVPASRVVTVNTWFYADKKYAPVIAVKVSNTAGAKDDAENLEEGDVLTVDALKKAAEEAAEAETETE